MYVTIKLGAEMEKNYRWGLQLTCNFCFPLPPFLMVKNSVLNWLRCAIIIEGTFKLVCWISVSNSCLHPDNSLLSCIWINVNTCSTSCCDTISYKITISLINSDKFSVLCCVIAFMLGVTLPSERMNITYNFMQVHISKYWTYVPSDPFWREGSCSWSFVVAVR